MTSCRLRASAAKGGRALLQSAVIARERSDRSNLVEATCRRLLANALASFYRENVSISYLVLHMPQKDKPHVFNYSTHLSLTDSVTAALGRPPDDDKSIRVIWHRLRTLQVDAREE